MDFIIWIILIIISFLIYDFFRLNRKIQNKENEIDKSLWVKIWRGIVIWLLLLGCIFLLMLYFIGRMGSLN